MQPEQADQPQPTTPQNNYDFIINPAKPPRKPVWAGGNSMAMRALLVLGGIFILLIVFVVIKNVLGSSVGGLDKAAMLSVAQDQTELLHLSTTGVQDSVSQSTKNFSITAQLSLTSEQSIFLSYLKSAGYKPKAKALALKQSAVTDGDLASAQTSSTFDTAYTSVMKTALATYQADLTAAYAKAGTQGKAILQDEYNGANLLLTQLTDGS